VAFSGKAGLSGMNIRLRYWCSAPSLGFIAKIMPSVQTGVVTVQNNSLLMK
jgi:hypothetical protein